MKGLGFPVMDANHVRDGGCRRGCMVCNHDLAKDILDRLIGGLDGVGSEAAHDQSTISVGGSGWAVGIHTWTSNSGNQSAQKMKASRKHAVPLLASEAAAVISSAWIWRLPTRRSPEDETASGLLPQRLAAPEGHVQ